MKALAPTGFSALCGTRCGPVCPPASRYPAAISWPRLGSPDRGPYPKVSSRPSGRSALSCAALSSAQSSYPYGSPDVPCARARLS